MAVEKLAIIGALGFLLSGCEDFGFDSCPDDLPRGSTKICACKTSQLTNPEHACCETTTGSCAPAPTLPPECRASVTIPPRVVVPLTLRASMVENGDSAIFVLCRPIRLDWAYGNAMAGPLEPPDDVRVPIPQLRVSEPGAVGSEVQVSPAPWPALQPCEISAQNKVFPSGIMPSFETSTFPATFVASLALLPLSAGDQTISIRADLPDDINECID